MMMDIFSSFDDHNSTIFSMYLLMWIVSVWSLFFINSSMWILPSNIFNSISYPKHIINIQMTRSFSMNMGGFSLILSSLFITIINFNLLGLLPYMFSLTSHLSMSFCLSLPLWLSLIISSYQNNYYSSFASLLPTGTPSFLIMFLPIIELLSISVRPVTLAIRIAANISAGHIILTLIGNYLTFSILSFNILTMILIMIIQTMYFMFEIGIGIIQGYIFTLLITLYTDDHQ
uniref:ATP synthase subunit a n=1 Tax=Opisthoteuthis californiana TaxID=167140 RepID=A0A9E9JKB1_9MOLL|nr:ATP synthase F0 subunit 6 [Opisthoteuthis californiana]WAP91376.1 ATP synthase F0 subunit 6 [Opisthoteuthis californiana]